jgi:hypothetical protein
MSVKYKLTRCNPDRINMLREHLPGMGGKQMLLLAKMLAAKLTIVIETKEELFATMTLFHRAFNKALTQHPKQREYEASRTRLWMNWLEMNYVKLWRHGANAVLPEPFPFADRLAPPMLPHTPSQTLAAQIAKRAW